MNSTSKSAVDYSKPENWLGPVKAIRRYCRWCTCQQSKEIKLCPSESCPIWPYRFGKKPEPRPRLTSLKSLRAKCLDCAPESTAHVQRCTFTNCPFWPYRMGHNPALKGRKVDPAHIRRMQEAKKRAQKPRESRNLLCTCRFSA